MFTLDLNGRHALVLGVANHRSLAWAIAQQLHGAGASLHRGHFHGVDNAVEIRDLILERLKRYRESGLGDPEEARRTAIAAALPLSGAITSPAGTNDLLLAARELAAEARALRVALN